MRILVVDDHPGSAEPLAEYLGTSGYEVDLAENGVDAIYLLTERSYDVVITDGNMPMMSGYDLCRYVRSRYPDTYVIGISGSRSLDEFRAAGAHAFFNKPCDCFIFQEMIASRFSQAAQVA